VGEIHDEYDDEERSFVRLNEHTYVFEAKTLLSDFYKILKIDPDTFARVEGDADTLAGLLLEIKGDFPARHESIEFDRFRFEVLEMTQRRITKVKVTVKKGA
jgi:CBS domain containing-hemolysin-like protein